MPSLPSKIPLRTRDLILLVLGYPVLCIVLLTLSDLGFTSPRKREQIKYEQSLKVHNENIRKEQAYQKQLQVLIDQSQETIRQYERTDSLLSVEYSAINSRLNQINKEYEKITDRYRDISKDSLRRVLFRR